MSGWGSGRWGDRPWGAGVLLRVVSAAPLRENVVRIEFNLPVSFTGFLDFADASDRTRYSLTASGLDGDGHPVRPVFPAIAAPAPDGSSLVDLTVDRHFSSWPAAYVVSVNRLVSAGGIPLATDATSASFPGLAYDELGGANKTLASGGDIANPQTESGLSVGATPEQSAILGAYPVSSAGDYATDEGTVSWKKRLFRRLLARSGGFAALPKGYGLGAADEVKKLLRAGQATRLAARAQAQLLADPETASATVTVSTVLAPQGVVWFTINATRTTGEKISGEKIRIG